MLRQSRALEKLSHGVTVTRKRRFLPPVYNAVTSPILYKAEAEAELDFVKAFDKYTLYCVCITSSGCGHTIGSPDQPTVPGYLKTSCPVHIHSINFPRTVQCIYMLNFYI